MGISRYNSEGYADPTAYQAIRNMETFQVDHPAGCIEVNIDRFFPCTVAKSRKLFKLICENCSKAQQDELLKALARKAKSCADEAARLEESLDDTACESQAYRARLRRFKALTRQHSRLIRNIQDLTSRRQK